MRRIPSSDSGVATCVYRWVRRMSEWPRILNGPNVDALLDEQRPSRRGPARPGHRPPRGWPSRSACLVIRRRLRQRARTAPKLSSPVVVSTSAITGVGPLVVVVGEWRE